MIWSNAHEMKSANWNSTTGRSPISAAPQASPVKPDSAIGLSITRRGPEPVQEALGHLERAAELADVLADQEHVRVGVHLAGQAAAIASR